LRYHDSQNKNQSIVVKQSESAARQSRGLSSNTKNACKEEFKTPNKNEFAVNAFQIQVHKEAQNDD